MDWDTKTLGAIVAAGHADTLEGAREILETSTLLPVWPCPPGRFECCLYARAYKTVSDAQGDVGEWGRGVADGVLAVHRFFQLDQQDSVVKWALGDAGLSPGAHWRNNGEW